MQQRIQQLRPQLKAFEELCRELVDTPADVALAWLLNQPAVTATIVGPRTAD
jgi:aryl-alcohol dehydrogenase-like predicted oxidoreductase